MIDIRIQTFLTLARVQSYTKAADILNITQPAISQHIKYLEKKYYCQLFERTTKHVALTNEGKRFYEYAQKLYRANEDLSKAMNNLHFIDKKQCIGATRTMAEDIAPDMIEAYHKLYPNIAFSVYIDNIDVIVDQLNQKKISLALVDGAVDRKKYMHHKLKDDVFYVISAKENQLSKSQLISIDEMINHPFIARETGSSTRAAFENALESLGYSLHDFNTVIEVNSVRFAKKMVSRNLGISVMPYERIRHEIEYDMLNYYQLEGLQAKRECQIIYLNDYPDQEFIQQFIEVSEQTDFISPKVLPTKPW